jgi:hypothetical protein
LRREVLPGLTAVTLAVVLRGLGRVRAARLRLIRGR